MPTNLPSQSPQPWFNDLRKLGFVFSVIVALCGAGRVVYVGIQANEADKTILKDQILEVDRKSSEHIQETLNILKNVQQKGEETAAQVAANQAAALARVDRYAPILALQTQATAVQDTRLGNLATLVGKIADSVDRLTVVFAQSHEDLAVMKAQRGYSGPGVRNN